jgi:hypothetical protein
MEGFASTTLDTSMEVLHRGIWQLWLDGCVPCWSYEDDGVRLLWQGVIDVVGDR